MSDSDSSTSWLAGMRSLVDAAGAGTLSLFALVVLVAGAGIRFIPELTEGLPQTILMIGLSLSLVLVVLFAGLHGVRSGVRSGASETSLVQTIWSSDDVPLSEQLAGAWRGSWQCRWTWRTPEGKLESYVDDLVTLDSIDEETGFVRGKGHSSYQEGVTYRIAGRISKKGLGVFYYSSSGTPYAGLDGAFLVRRFPLGAMRGWWCGAGRRGGDVFGEVTFERLPPGQPAVKKAYPVPERVAKDPAGAAAARLSAAPPKTDDEARRPGADSGASVPTSSDS